MEEFWQSLDLHRQNLLDSDLRNNFLKAFCQFVLSTDNHFYHENDCIESLGIFSLNIQNNYLQNVLEKLGTQLKTCKNCIDAFHAQVDRYLVHLGSHFGSTAIKEVESQISAWTIMRQCAHLQSFIATLKASPKEEKSIRMSAIFLIYELLNFPVSFINSEINDLFIEFLKCCQISSKFKLKVSDKIFPGLSLSDLGFAFLICHKTEFVREWASDVLSSSTVFLQDDQINLIAPLLVVLYTNITNCFLTAKNRTILPPVEFSKFAMVRAENDLWKAFMKVVGIIPRESILAFFSHSSLKFDRMLVYSFLDRVNCCFWDRLSFLSNLLLHNNLCRWILNSLDSSKGPELFLAISTAPEFTQVVSKEIEDESLLSESMKSLFDWIAGILNLMNTVPSWACDVVANLWKLSGSWSPFFSYLLHQKLFDLEQSCKQFTQFDQFILISFFKSGINVRKLDHSISKRLQYATKRIMHRDLKTVWNFDFGTSTDALSIHVKFWSIVEEIAIPFKRPFEDLISAVNRLFMHGPSSALEANTDMLNFLLDQASKAWSTKLVELDLDWKEILYCCYFNNLSLQSSGHAALLKHTDSTSLDEALSVLASLHQVDLLEFVFEVARTFKQRHTDGHVVPFSARSLLDHFSALGKIYFPFNGRDSKIAFNLWLNLYLFCMSVLGSFKKWYSDDSVDISMAKSAVKQSFTEMRTFLGFRNVVMLYVKKETIIPLFKDWAKENVDNTKIWLLSDNVELNFCASAFLIDMFKALQEDEKIEMPIYWKDSLDLDYKSIINESQRDVIKVFLEVKKRKVEDNTATHPAKKSVTSPSQYDRAPRNYGISTENEKSSSFSFRDSEDKFPESSISRLFSAQRKQILPPDNISRFTVNIRKSSSSSKLTALQRLKHETAATFLANGNIQSFNSKSTTPSTLSAILGRTEEDVKSPKEARKTIQISIPEVRKPGFAIQEPFIPKPNSIRIPLVKMQKLFDMILTWNENAVKSSKPFGNPSSVPDTFVDGHNYSRIFEPLFFMECRESFRNAYVEYRRNKSYKLILSELKKVDKLHQISLLMSWENHKSENWGENSVLILNSKDEKFNVVALVRKVRNIKSDIVLDCEINIIPAEKYNFAKNSEWTGRYLLSMTTQIREYQALSRLNSIALYQTIINPPRLGAIPFDSLSLDQLMKNLTVNEPQAIAISRALKQKTGFVLIQGPPGTGKTKTILGLVAALQKTGVEISEPSQVGVSKTGSYHSIKNRLMICAPSNAAIDEICRRLMGGINNFNGRKYFPNIVRIGKVTSIHPDAFEASLVNFYLFRTA
jgi:AAA domain/SEN1 N terminal